MKVWKARFTLFINDDMEWNTLFRFELQKKDYIRVGDHYVEEGNKWSAIDIPVNMNISRFYGTYRVKQGFDRELNEDELKALELEMKNRVINTLIQEKEDFINEYEQKMKAVKGE